MARRPKAKPVWIQLKEPFRAFYSVKSALRDTPSTTEAHWHKFDSKMEYERYLYLLACLDEGLISSLVPHPDTYEIVVRTKLPKNAIRKETRYKQRRVYTPDFFYICKDVSIFEDFKGYKTSRGASLQHTLFIRMLIDRFKFPPKSFHFKVVTDVTADPSNE